MNSILKILLFVLVIYTVQSAPFKKGECKKYLKKYGYLLNLKVNEENYKKAIEHFQKKFGLPITGKLDFKTNNLMHKPRCGKSDNLTNIYTKNPWGKQTLTYKLQSFPRNGLDRTATINAITKAFNLWGKYIPIKFVLKAEGSVDIDITFMPYERGDGIGNALAYAYYPRNGDIYFDAEPWTLYTDEGTNLFNVAVHEIGHSLGLRHSDKPDAIMNPYILPYDPNLDLRPDDIYRIQNLYGQKTNSIPENICNINKVDAIVFNKNDQSTYLIKDNFSWKIQNGKIESSYPKNIREIWPGIPETVDAAYYDQNSFYFGKDITIWKFDGTVQHYLDLIQKLDAAEMIDNNLYLFSGSKLWVFDMSNNNQIMKPNFPQVISTYFKNGPKTVDAVYYDGHNFNLFKDSTVYIFNSNRKLTKNVSLKKWLQC